MCSLSSDILGGPGARYLLQGGMFEAKKGVFINKVALYVYDLTTFPPRLFRLIENYCPLPPWPSIDISISRNISPGPRTLDKAALCSQ